MYVLPTLRESIACVQEYACKWCIKHEWMNEYVTENAETHAHKHEYVTIMKTHQPCYVTIMKTHQPCWCIYSYTQMHTIFHVYMRFHWAYQRSTSIFNLPCLATLHMRTHMMKSGPGHSHDQDHIIVTAKVTVRVTVTVTVTAKITTGLKVTVHGHDHIIEASCARTWVG